MDLSNISAPSGIACGASNRRKTHPCADLSIEARSQVALEIIKRAEMADPVQTESERVKDANVDPYADEMDPYAW